jgi:hypothetical protein
MNMRRVFVTFLVAAVAAALIAPASAFAGQFSTDRSIMGLEAFPPTYTTPYIHGDNILYRVSTGVPLWRYNLVSGARYALPPAAGANSWTAIAAGDWVVWVENWDITAKNLKTGSVKHVTNDPDPDVPADSNISISDADGTYVVWARANGAAKSVMGKNLATSGSMFTIASGANNPRRPSIYGKRVAYVADWNGRGNVFIETIGSSAAPIRITSYTGEYSIGEESLNIGSHLVVWREWTNATTYTIHYYDFDTDQTYEVPTGISSMVYRLGVSGDRILYFTGGSDSDIRIWDTRIAKTTPGLAAFDISTGDSGYEGWIDGSRIAYRSATGIYFAKLLVPSISLNSVPTRIPHLGHIHLKGSISDQGIRIGGAKLGIEKYSSGKWTRIKTITASSTGSFSYQTPHNHSKTKYRVVYDGFMTPTGPPAQEHLSTVSSVKTAWPR